jgi:protocatechuate 3,4-dioxygenase beta subunit
VQAKRVFLLVAASALWVGLAPHALAQSGSSTTGVTLPPGSMGPPPGQPRATTGTGVVIGRVIDQGSGQPVSGAVVTIGSTGLSTTTNMFIGGPTLRTSTPGALDGSNRSSDLRVLTDGQGRFAFLDLPAGSFQFGVMATGYIGGGYGQRRPGSAPQPFELADGQRVADVVVPVWKFGAFSGTITDEAGEPIVGLPVTVLQWQVLAGRRRLVGSGQSAATDDRGVYRIGTLTPGDYVVAVVVPQTSKPLAIVEEGRGVPAGELPASVARASDPATLPGSATAQQSGNSILTISRAVPPAAPAAGRVLSYQTTFYPAARTVGEATVVTVGSGQERANVDIQLRLAPTSSVSGIVSGPSGPAGHVSLRLVPAGLDDLAVETGFEGASTITEASGAFSFMGVAPGQYVLRATFVPGSDRPLQRGPTVITEARAATAAPAGPFLYANQPVSVGDADVRNLAVTLRQGATVSGSYQFEGTKERPAAEAFRNVAMTVSPADGRTVVSGNAAALRAGFDANGAATTGGLAPGRYVLTSSAPAGWTFKAALYNGKDISTSPLEVESTDISGVVFVFTDRTSEIAGTVQNASGSNDGDATVLLFPADPRLWADGGAASRRMKTMRTTKTGAYALAVVPEGEYFIVAVRDEVAGDWPEPKFLESLRGLATRIAIVDGDRKTVNLRTVR